MMVLARAMTSAKRAWLFGPAIEAHPTGGDAGLVVGQLGLGVGRKFVRADEIHGEVDFHALGLRLVDEFLDDLGAFGVDRGSRRFPCRRGPS